MALPANLTLKDAQEIVDDLVAAAYSINISLHGQARGQQRTVSHDEILEVLRVGAISEPPWWDAEYRDWKAWVVASISGDKFKVLVAIDEDARGRRSLDVVTVVVK